MAAFIIKNSQHRSKREELKKILRATIAAYDLAIQEPTLAKQAIGKYTRTTDAKPWTRPSRKTSKITVAHPLCVAGRTHVDH